MEPSNCFTYLADNAPLWIKSLEKLELRVQKKEDEVAKVPIPVPQKLKKSSSNESIRPSPLNTSSPSTGLEVTSSPQPTNVPQLSVADLLTASRKRKTMSLVSAAPGIHKYRSRNTITVYYDSEVQDAFDRLVRNISTGRNGIRKAKMAQRIAMLSDPGTTTHSAFSPPSRSPAGLMRQGGFGVRPPPGSARNDLPPEAREQADQALDRAQGFCERGAHQFLRDGDCNVEITGAKAAFEVVLKISQAEIESSKKQALEQQQVVRTELKLEADLTQEIMQKGSISEHPALMNSMGLIEADDDDVSDDDEELGDLTSLPSPPFRSIART